MRGANDASRSRSPRRAASRAASSASSADSTVACAADKAASGWLRSGGCAAAPAATPNAIAIVAKLHTRCLTITTIVDSAWQASTAATPEIAGLEGKLMESQPAGAAPQRYVEPIR